MDERILVGVGGFVCIFFVTGGIIWCIGKFV